MLMRACALMMALTVVMSADQKRIRFGPAPELPPTYTAATCSKADIQAKVDLAVNGDIIAVPAGTCAWADGEWVAWSNKDIWVRGAGIGNTIISHSGTGNNLMFLVTVTNSARGGHRISGFSFAGDLAKSVIRTDATGVTSIPTGRWRVDHNDFDFPSTTSRIGIEILGPSYGLIDHNTFTNWYGNGNAIRMAGLLATEQSSPPCSGKVAGDLLHSQPLDLGTNKFVFIEDNTFDTNPASLVVLYDSSGGGGRIVYRHNTSTAGFLYTHWTRTCEYAATTFEVYNNTFTGNATYNSYPARFESGTGVFYNNAILSTVNNYLALDDRRATGYVPQETNADMYACDGTQDHDGNAGDPSAPGWPCLGQIGRSPGKTIAAIRGGDKQASAPLYLWNNGTTAGCANGGACTDSITVSASPSAYIKGTAHPNGDVDYILSGTTPKPGYTPYTYPHPLVTAGWTP